MRRREFVALVGAAAARPSLAWAQAAMPLIGFMSSRSPGESASVVAAFRKGWPSGFAEGRNVAIAFRWAEGRYAELPQLAAELVGLKVAVLFAAGGTPAARAAKEATSAIPVVFSAAPDPVGFGLVASLHRPGGNITGMATLTSELGAKSVEVLKDLLPKAAVIAYLLNPSNPSSDAEAEGGRTAARALGVELRFLSARTERELDESSPPSRISALMRSLYPLNRFSTAGGTAL